MAVGKTLKASILIGGAVTSSLKSSLGSTQASLKRIGTEIATIDRRQRLLARSIDVFGRQGRSVDRMRREYAALTMQADRLRAAQERLGRAQARIDANNARRQALGGKLRGAVGGALAIAVPVGASLRSGAVFERESTLIGATANMTREQVAAMNRAILGTSAATNQMASDVQKSMGFLVAAGLDAQRAQAALKPIGKAATAAGADIEDLSRASFTLMDSLKIAPSQLGRALNILHVAGKEGNVELRDMAKTLPVLGASFVALKMRGTEAAATMGAALEIARKGAGDANEAANNLRNYMAKVLAPETLKKAKKNFGLDLYQVIQDAQTRGGNPFEESLRAIMKATAGDAKKIGELFGDMQVQNFLKPMIQNWDEYQRIKDKALNGSRGAIESDFTRMMGTSAEKVKALRASLDRLGKTMGMALTPQVGATSDKLRHLVDSVSLFVQENPRLVRGIVGTAVALAGLRVATLGVGYAWATAKAPVLSGMRFVAKWRADGAVKAMGRMGPAATKAAAGVRLIGMAVAGIGLGTIGVAVGALVGGALLIRKYWEPIKAFVSGAFDGIRETAAPALAQLGDALAPLKPAWDAVSGAIGSAWQWVTKLLEPVHLTPEGFDKARGAGVKFGNVVGGAVAVVANRLREVVELIGFVGRHWGKINAIGRIASGNIVGGVGQLWQSFRGKPDGAAGTVEAPRPRIGAASDGRRQRAQAADAKPMPPPPGIAKPGATTVQAPITNHFTIHQNPEEDPNLFARRVVRVMNEESRERLRLSMEGE